MSWIRVLKGMALCVAGLAAASLNWAPEARAQSPWKPDKPVEIVLPTGAGGTNDQMARLIQKALQDQKLVSVPTLVMNKAGGNQSLAVVYLNQHAADPHYLLYSTATVFTNEIAGLTKQRYTELTPIALLLVDYTVISVKADSPLKSMRDLVARLKADPESIAFGLVSRGGPNHLAAAQAMKAAGIESKKLKLVVFKTNAETATAVAGGHIHAMVSSVSAALPQVEAGNARILGIAAPQRQTGKLAQVPTMREEGMNATGIPNWRGIMGAKGITAEQSAFWSRAFAKVTATEDWLQQLDKNNVAPHYLAGDDLTKWLAAAYEDTRTVMADLGLVK
ncbi:MAG: tripartite tricarboxylate transporter substrate binding protein [Burkholderiales bacterium]|nr:tripartite tricarboxylate transporter substrate binding protein [Burkholderiales bacterium]